MRRSIRTLFANLFDAHPNSSISHRLHPFRHHLAQLQTGTFRKAYVTDVSQVHQPSIYNLSVDLLPNAGGNQSHHHQPIETTQPDRPLEKQRNPKTIKNYKLADLQRELYWVRDPLKLANKVMSMLKKDDPGDYYKVLALVRLASKDMVCIVSWNHLVDYNMSKGKVKAAIATYNEVGSEKSGPNV